MAVNPGTDLIHENAVIDRENQTYMGENLQLCFKTKDFQSHYSFGKLFSFNSKKKLTQVLQLD